MENEVKMNLLRAKSYNNYHGVRPLLELAEGTRTLVSNPVNNKRNHEPSEVTIQAGLRSYVIRNRRHLKDVITPKVNHTHCETNSQLGVTFPLVTFAKIIIGEMFKMRRS